MATRKIEFQTIVQDDKQWEEEMKKKGLIVVDVHSTWCGPCKAIVPTFQRLYLDMSDRPLRFLVADAEKITALKAYAGRSKPLFLFYKGGQVIETVEGVNAPLLTRLIQSNTPKDANEE